LTSRSLVFVLGVRNTDLRLTRRRMGTRRQVENHTNTLLPDSLLLMNRCMQGLHGAVVRKKLKVG
jgi:hypothetical protein